jgi:hypothetical protein
MSDQGHHFIASEAFLDSDEPVASTSEFAPKRPVASRERVAEVLAESRARRDGNPGMAWSYLQDGMDDIGALFAAGVFRDEATVKAEALRDAALVWDGADEGDPVSNFLHERAAALLAGESS